MKVKKHFFINLKTIPKLLLGITLVFVFIIAFLIFPINLKYSFAQIKIVDKQYARITRSNIPVYSEPQISNSKILFYPELNYFVQLVEPQQSSFYKIRYCDAEGFILASDLVFVSGEPQTPYPENINIKILSNTGLNLRTTPSTSEGPFNIITTLPFLENNIKFIAKTYGEEYAPDMGDIWYYCSYISNQTSVNGYLYSVYCYPLGEIEKNTEVLDIVEKPYFPETTTEVQTNPSDVLSSMPKPVQIILIIIVCLPCIIIVYLLIKPTKLAVDVGKNKKKKIKRLKKSDYYELDD